MAGTQRQPLAPFMLAAIILPVSSGYRWSLIVILLGVFWFGAYARPLYPSLCTRILSTVVVAGLGLQAIYAAVDSKWPLLPLMPSTQPDASHNHVSVYVATRDFYDYPSVLSSIADSYSNHHELPSLKLVLLDVGSVRPVPFVHPPATIERMMNQQWTIERIRATGDSGVPVFHAFEHIARTATSHRIFFFDEDNLVSPNFEWPRYMTGSWFFGKGTLTWSSCMSVPRVAFVEFVDRLRAAPHLYMSNSRWGGQEDQQAIFSMALEKAPDRLSYYKANQTTMVQLEEAPHRSWFDSIHVGSSYLLEWTREQDPPPSFCANVDSKLNGGLLCQPVVRALVRSYGIFALIEFLLVVWDCTPYGGRIMTLLTGGRNLIWDYNGSIMNMIGRLAQILVSTTFLFCICALVTRCVDFGLARILARFHLGQHEEEDTPLLKEYSSKDESQDRGT